VWVSRVRVQDDRPRVREPLSLAWPEPPTGPAARYEADLPLRVEAVTYRRLAEEPVTVSSAQGRVRWKSGTLSLTEATLRAPSLGLRGEATAGFREPSLSADLRVALPEPLLGADRLTAKVRLRAAGGRERVAGPVELSALRGTERVLALGGEVAVLAKAVEFERLVLVQPGR
jgi:hypothetical protein